VVLSLFKTQTLAHFLIQKSLALAVGLNPLAVNDKLWDGAFAGARHHFVGRSGRGFDIDLFEQDVVPLEKAFGFPAVSAPKRGIDQQFHGLQSKISLRLQRHSLSELWIKAFNRGARKFSRAKENRAASIKLTADS
jgi:hypothetical protein